MKALVEAPNFQLYLHWLAFTGRKAFEYPYLKDWSVLVSFHGEVIVLNGGSLDPSVRSQVRHLEVAGQLTVSRREV